MSQENIDAIKRGYEALRGNDIETFLSFVHPDAEWHSLILEIEGVFKGREGVRAWRGQWSGQRGRSRPDFWQAVEFRDGLLSRYWAVRTEEEALKVAGLS